MHRYIRLAWVLVWMALIFIPGGAAHAQDEAQDDTRCFAETGHCIAGRVRTFWEQHGGLAVFGLPITPQQAESIEGQSYQVQWFERARFELHPELDPPYDVLLGRLGAQLLADAAPAPPVELPENSDAVCRSFVETGHQVCGPILAAWRANGLEFDGRPGVSEAESLALFGLPMSPLETRTLADGQRYQVQWFERARFELHPEHDPPFDVLLGLLGSEMREEEAPPAQPPPVARPVLPPPDEVSERLRVPAGFAVRMFAEGMRTPRLMALGPDGALLVAERDAGRIVRLPDRDGDGRADGNEIFVDGLQGPHNMEWYNGCLYVAENHQVSRHCDTNSDGMPDQRSAIVALPTGGGHTSRTLRIGPDGMLYVAVGSTCNVCAEADPRRAAILRYTLDGGIPADNPFANDPNPDRRAIWAGGLRNSVDFLFMPNGQLWATHNGRDNMIGPQEKDDRPLEEVLVQVQGGRHHGWPYCTSERPDGSLEPGPGPYIERPDPSDDVPAAPAGFRCEDTVPAIYTTIAHSAPLGIERYNGTQFPAEYRGDIFVALHGSWNRIPPAPCQILRIHIEEGRPVASTEFLTGFQRDAGQRCGDAWGRPAGVTVGNDGALYVSDDHNGRIYRIVHTTIGMP